MKNTSKNRFLPKFLTWLGWMVIILGLTSWTFHWPVALRVSAREQPHAQLSVDSNALSRDTRMVSSFADVVDKMAPCVVYVYSTRTVRNSPLRGFSPFEDPFFRRFFGRQFDQDHSRRPRTFKEHGLGSGVLVSRDGYILTNNHVVEGADEVKVALANDKKEYPATVVGRDAKTDLAVLKIDQNDLPFATLGDSDQLKVGDVVLAVGNPFGVGQTVTMGIISATRRGGMGIEQYEDFIQTDAAINPGNSGGALVDTDGRLVGINTAIISRTGGYQGVGFAVPINIARNVMKQLIDTGHVVRGYLGVSIQSLTPELAGEFNAPDDKGALIGSVTEDSAAAAAGLKSGDIIVGFDGKPVKDSRQLMLLVGATSPGTRVKVKVLRDGKEKTFDVKLKQMPDEESEVASAGGPKSNSGDLLDGVGVANLDATARRRLDIPDSVTGALVNRIDPGSPSYESGLRTGDVIQEIDHQRVHDADDAVSASNAVAGDHALLRVWSQGGSHFLVVKRNE